MIPRCLKRVSGDSSEMLTSDRQTTSFTDCNMIYCTGRSENHSAEKSYFNLFKFCK